MKIALLTLSLLVVVNLVSCYGGEPTPTSPTSQGDTVSIENFAFVPAALSVPQGTKVTWTNKDSAPHTVTGQGFDSRALDKGDTFSKTFAEPGSYAYHCGFHSSMQGVVEVK